jgi:hypothetical protein
MIGAGEEYRRNFIYLNDTISVEVSKEIAVFKTQNLFNVI